MLRCETRRRVAERSCKMFGALSVGKFQEGIYRVGKDGK